MVFLIVNAMLFISCSNELDKTIRSAISDGVISNDEWEKLKTESLSTDQFIGEDGGIDTVELKNHVVEYAKSLRGVDSIVFSSEGESGSPISPILFKFFLERSGSMIPYDAPSTNGYFKIAIADLLSAVPNSCDENNLMFIVNNKVTPFHKTFKDFVQSSDIMKETDGYGDPKYTDFSCIFDSVLNRTKDNEVSILVSDMIYSDKNYQNKSPERITEEASLLTKKIFRGHEDKDILIIKLNSGYNGQYYPYNNPIKGNVYLGNRPYYMMIVAKSDVMHRLFNLPEYSRFCDFKHLKGYENYYCFTRQSDNPKYSILFKGSSRFKAEKQKKTEIHSIKRLTADRSGETKLVVAVDMSSIITEPEYLTNVQNYQVQSKSGFVVSDVKAIDKADMPGDIYHYVPTATHLLELTTTEGIVNETVSVSLMNKFPLWIEKSSTNDDRNTKTPSFANTTFGFKSMMYGIYEAIYPTIKPPVYYELILNVKK